MSILVTGGAGYIGSHTCVELLCKGEDVVIVDNFCNSKPEVVETIKALSDKDIPIYKNDILDETAGLLYYIDKRGGKARWGQKLNGGFT